MSRYVQTFSDDEQAILNHTIFWPSLCRFTKVKENEAIEFLWVNLGCIHWSLPEPNQDLPRIRREDITAFRDTWIRGENGNLTEPLRCYFAPSKWVQDGGGYVAGILSYCTFKLSVYSEISGHAVEFSTADVDEVLTSCLEMCQGDEMPTCNGEWTRNDERVQWLVQPIPRSHVKESINFNKRKLRAEALKELAKQCDVLIALRRFYRPVRGDVSRDLHPVTKQRNVAYNLWLEGYFLQLPGVSRGLLRNLPEVGRLAGEYAQKNVQELMDLFMKSHHRFTALDYAYCQMPELSAMLEEFSAGSAGGD